MRQQPRALGPAGRDGGDARKPDGPAECELQCLRAEVAEPQQVTTVRVQMVPAAQAGKGLEQLLFEGIAIDDRHRYAKIVALTDDSHQAMQSAARRGGR